MVQDNPPGEGSPSTAPARPRGPEDVTAAVVAAAVRLIAERGPSAVSLRDIAAEAGVNYGLIHRYFGTKDEVLRAVFRTVSGQADARIAPAPDLHGMLEELWRPTAGGESYTRMLAWLLLEGRDPDELLGRSPAVARLADAVAEAQAEARARVQAPAGGAPAVDPRLAAAATVLLSIGWRLFSPYLISAADLHDRSPEELRRELGRLVDLLIDAAVEGSRPTT